MSLQRGHCKAYYIVSSCHKGTTSSGQCMSLQRGHCKAYSIVPSCHKGTTASCQCMSLQRGHCKAYSIVPSCHKGTTASCQCTSRAENFSYGPLYEIIIFKSSCPILHCSHIYDAILSGLHLQLYVAGTSGESLNLSHFTPHIAPRHVAHANKTNIKVLARKYRDLTLERTSTEINVKDLHKV